MAYSGGFSPTLGGLFELWEQLQHKNFIQCKKEQILPLSFGGSTLSIQNYLKGYCPSCDKIHDTQVEGLVKFYKFCAEYAHEEYISLSNDCTARQQELVNLLLKE